MCFEHAKLKGKIIEKYGSQSAFVKAFGASANTFSKKMNNKVRFSTDDILKIIKMLDISESDIGAYFLQKKFKILN